MYMYHNLFIHLSADGHLGYFHVIVIVNSAAVNIGVHVSLSILVSLLCMPSSGVAGSYGSYTLCHLCVPLCESLGQDGLGVPRILRISRSPP